MSITRKVQRRAKSTPMEPWASVRRAAELWVDTDEPGAKAATMDALTLDNYQRGYDDGWNRAMKCVAEMIRAGVNIETVRAVAERKGK